MSNESSVASAQSPTKTSWPSVAAIIFTPILFFASQAIAAIAIGVYGGLQHHSSSSLQEWTNNSVTAQFLFILLAEAIVIGSITLFVRHYKQRLSAIGLTRPRFANVLYGLGALPIYFGLYFVAIGVIKILVPGFNAEQQQEIGFDSVHGTVALIMTFVSIVVLPPLAEEIMFRGFLYTSFKKLMPIAGAVVLTSSLFAIAHLPEGGSGGPLYVAAVDTFILSLVLIYLREKTGSLWASITLHAAKNGVAFLLLYVFHAG